MGNLIGIDENFGKIDKSQLKSKLTHTALGRYSTPVLSRHSAKELARVREKKSSTKSIKPDFNANVYKNIFPAPKNNKMRNTVSPFSSKPTLDEVESGERIGEANDFSNNNKNNSSYLDQNDNLIFSRSSDAFMDSNISKVGEFELKWEKSSDSIRHSYIAKLIYKKVWQPDNKEKNHNALIIFDWDDTLLCTSFLTPNGVFTDDIKISEKDMEKIKKLETSSSTILKLAISSGDTYIITNAAPGWVEYSAYKFYPEVAKLLNKVTIVSARGEYEKKHPGDSRQWKILAFLEMLKTLNINLVTNLICLGDSIIEMEAAHILASKFSHAYIKTIKFRESPKPEELIKQLNLVIDQFSKIFSAIKNLTIRVEKKSKDKPELDSK